MNETVDPDSIIVAEPIPKIAEPASRARRKSYRLGRILFWFVVLAALAALGYKLFWAQPAPSDATNGARSGGGPPQTVRAAAAALGEMPITINALGAVTPLATVTIKTQIAGRLMSVAFQEGQIVKQNDFLAQIDARPYEATLAQMQAQLAKDTALRDQAIADYQRYETLTKQDSISRQQVEDQKYLVAQYVAAMGTDQAQIDAAKLNIEYCHIVAPVGGRVGLRLVDPGNYVQPTDTTGLVVIAQIEPISVIFSTPEDNLRRITRRLKDGGKLPVAVYDRANVTKIGDGELTTYDNEIDTTTGTFKLRAMVENKGDELFPSQFVNVRLLVDTLKDVVVVPNAAVQVGAAGPFVYRVEDDSTVAVRKVTQGPSDAALTVIESGVRAGDKVVIDGVDRLRDGAKVRVTAAESQSDAAAPGAGKAGGGGSGGGQHHRHRDGDATGAPTASPGAAP